MVYVGGGTVLQVLWGGELLLHWTECGRGHLGGHRGSGPVAAEGWLLLLAGKHALYQLLNRGIFLAVPPSGYSYSYRTNPLSQTTLIDIVKLLDIYKVKCIRKNNNFPVTPQRFHEYKMMEILLLQLPTCSQRLFNCSYWELYLTPRPCCDEPPHQRTIPSIAYNATHSPLHCTQTLQCPAPFNIQSLQYTL